MSDKSRIEWTERTWNCTSGCAKVSQGCKNCYASRLVSTRLAHLPQNEGAAKDGNWTGIIKCHEDKLSEPLKRKKPTTYFVCSQSDLFHRDVPFEFIDKAFAVMALCTQHTFIVLTKRPERMKEYLAEALNRVCLVLENYPRSKTSSLRDNSTVNGQIGPMNLKQWPLDNVWLGTSVEDQNTADERIPELLKCPAAHRFLSCEPLLGMVDLSSYLYDKCDRCYGAGIIGDEDPQNDEDCSACDGLGFDPSSPLEAINLVIVGGESGPNARPMHPDWARSLRDQCAEAGVPFYFKQWGEWEPLHGFGLPSGDEYEQETYLPWCWVEPNGRTKQSSSGDPDRVMVRVGKAKAGRMLDGVLHDDLPWRKEQGS